MGNVELEAATLKMPMVFFKQVVHVARTPDGISVPRGSQYGYTSAREEFVPVMAFAKPLHISWGSNSRRVGVYSQ